MNALTTLSASLSTGSVEFAMTTKPNKKGEIKTGNIAHAFAFATATARKEISRDVYMAWLANGTYRPIIKAITAQLSGSAAVFANSLIGSGPVSKDVFVSFCRALVTMIDDTGKEPKGQKAFYYGLAKQVVGEYDRQSNEVIDQQ